MIPDLELEQRNRRLSGLMKMKTIERFDENEKELEELESN